MRCVFTEKETCQMNLSNEILNPLTISKLIKHLVHMLEEQYVLYS